MEAEVTPKVTARRHTQVPSPCSVPSPSELNGAGAGAVAGAVRSVCVHVPRETTDLSAQHLPLTPQSLLLCPAGPAP